MAERMAEGDSTAFAIGYAVGQAFRRVFGSTPNSISDQTVPELAEGVPENKIPENKTVAGASAPSAPTAARDVETNVIPNSSSEIVTSSFCAVPIARNESNEPSLQTRTSDWAGWGQQWPGPYTRFAVDGLDGFDGLDDLTRTRILRLPFLFVEYLEDASIAPSGKPNPGTSPTSLQGAHPTKYIFTTPTDHSSYALAFLQVYAGNSVRMLPS